MTLQKILFSEAGMVHGVTRLLIDKKPLATSTPDDSDTFEYSDMMTIPTMWVTSWAALPAFGLAVCLCFIPQLQLSGTVVYPVLCATSAVLAVLLYLQTSPPLAKLNKPFYTQPGCTFVRAALLTSGVLYAGVLLCLIPGPSKWRWLLAFTNSTRVLRLLVALRGEGQGVADAAVEVTGHVADEVM